MNSSKFFEWGLKEFLEDTTRNILGDYLWIIIVGVVFVIIFFLMCKTLHEVSMSQEEWNKKYVSEPNKKKLTRAHVFWLIFLTIASGSYLCYEINRLNNAKPSIRQEVQQNQTEEYFVGTSDDTGRDCYVVNETIHWTNRYDCHVTLKMVRPSDGNVQLLNYTFMIMQHWVDFENSQGFKDRLSQNYPIEWNMWKYIMKYSEQTGLRRP